MIFRPTRGLLIAATFLVLCAGGNLFAGEAQFEEDESAETTAADEGRFEPRPFKVSVTVRGGYDDNVTTRRLNTQSSLFTNAGLGLTYDFGSPRTKLSLGAGAGATYYFDRVEGRDYDFNTFIALIASHRVTARLALALNAYASYLSQPDFSFAAGSNRRAGDYLYTQDKLSLSYQWAPRFATNSSYTFGAVLYDDDRIGDFENRFEHTFGTEFRFLLLPTTTVIGEYRFQIVDYRSDIRDSTSHYLLAGVDHSFSPRFGVSARAGAQIRTYDYDPLFFPNAAADDTRTQPYFEGAINFALTPQSSLAWTARYSIEEPYVPGAPSRDTFRTGLQAQYAFSPRLIASTAIYYQHDENAGFTSGGVVSPAFSEDSFDITLAVRYAITRTLSAEFGYGHTEVISDIFLREYSRNRYYAGLTLAF